MARPVPDQRPRGTIFVQQRDDVLLTIPSVPRPLAFCGFQTDQHCRRLGRAQTAAQLQSLFKGQSADPMPIDAPQRRPFGRVEPSPYSDAFHRYGRSTQDAAVKLQTVTGALEDLLQGSNNGRVVPASALVRVLLKLLGFGFVPQKALCSFQRTIKCPDST